MKIDWKSSRKLSYPLNVVLFNFCRLWLFRNKTIWIFGAREGTKYDDNSRYMFEYVCREHHNKIRAIWLCNSESEVNRIVKDGHEAYLNSSIYGKWMQLRAGVALYSHGLIDFGIFPLVGGACCVALWHGLGFKKIYNGKYTGFSLKIKKTLDRFYSWTYRDISTATSQYSYDWTLKMFTLRESGIKITGYPRNDVFKYANREKLLDKLHFDKQKKIIIFMPTYRQPSLGINAMTNVIKELYDSVNLEKFLKDRNSVLLVKLHPLTPHIDLPPRDNFVVLDYDAVEDNQQLMAIADMLITDYSSCFVDYALLNRPIVFYTPDNEKFLKESEQMESEYFEIASLCQATTPQELVNCLKKPNMEVVDRTNELFEDESIKGTCYSENVFRVICQEMGID